MLTLGVTLGRWPITVHHLQKGEYREVRSGLTSPISNRTTADYNLRQQTDGCPATFMEQSNGSFESENGNAVKESKAQRPQKEDNTSLLLRKRSSRVGKHEGICMFTCQERQVCDEISTRPASPDIILAQDSAALQEAEIILCVFPSVAVTIALNVSRPA